MQMSIQPRSKAIRSEMFVVFDERCSSPERGRRRHLRSTTQPPSGLLPPEYENTLSLHKSLPQLQFISLFFFSPSVFCQRQMRLRHEMELLELPMQDGKAGTNKSHLSLFTRESLRAASLYCSSN